MGLDHCIRQEMDDSSPDVSCPVEIFVTSASPDGCDSNFDI